MTQEEKQLLLKDLCAKLPYGVKGRIFAETTNGEFDIIGDMIFNDEPFVVVLDEINVGNGEIRVTAIEDDETRDFIDSVQDWGDPYTIETFKPYLRPMSSMTEDEKEDYNSKFEGRDFSWEIYYGSTDWLNAHHFDYRCLIEKGLALEAPEGMY
jgi:hypothetical protein